MNGYMFDVFIGFLMLVGITFFGVLIWAVIYTCVKMFKEETNGKHN